MRRYIYLLLLISCLVLLFAGYKYTFESLALALNKLKGNQIESIFIEDTSNRKVIEITDRHEIDQIVESLQVNMWSGKMFWTLKLTPNLYVDINGYVIGLFETEPNYAKVFTNNETQNKSQYYRIPNVYNEISKYVQ